MRIRRLGWGLTACVLLSALYGAADAQTSTTSPSTGDTSVGMQRQVNLTPKEQLAQADVFLARMGVTGGCASPPPPALPSYCPAAPVNRQQMAVFLLKTYFGGTFNPNFCVGKFDDVPCPSPFVNYVEYLSNAEIAAGCSVSPPLYCPADPTKRKQMAAFLVKTFGLELYGGD